MNIRTHTCGELNSNDVEKSVVLNGWVNTVRLHGQVVFIDIRDRYGKTQIVFKEVKKYLWKMFYLFQEMFRIDKKML